MCQYRQKKLQYKFRALCEKKTHAELFHCILFGGGKLNSTYARGNNLIHSNSARRLDQLEGLLPVMEDGIRKCALWEQVLGLFIFILNFNTNS